MTIDESTGSKNIKVQRITQKDFDEMSEQKKTFYLDLIKKGQVKISDGDEKPKIPFNPYNRFIGVEVVITLVNGEIRGILDSVWQYEILVKLPDGRVSTIMKGAIVSMVNELPSTEPMP
jgi:hypothetical protein